MASSTSLSFLSLSFFLLRRDMSNKSYDSQSSYESAMLVKPYIFQQSNPEQRFDRSIVQLILMSGIKNKSISLYDRNNSGLRKKIVDSTLLQAQPQIQKQPCFKNVNLDLSKQQQGSPQAKQFTDRNMKFKVDQLQLNLQEFLNDLRGVRQENRELIDLIALLKQNLVYEELYGNKKEMEQKLQGLSNHIRATRENSQSRYSQIYSDCSQLWRRTEQLRENVFGIRMRVQRLQEKMGFRQMYQL